MLRPLFSVLFIILLCYAFICLTVSAETSSITESALQSHAKDNINFESELKDEFKEQNEQDYLETLQEINAMNTLPEFLSKAEGSLVSINREMEMASTFLSSAKESFSKTTKAKEAVEPLIKEIKAINIIEHEKKQKVLEKLQKTVKNDKRALQAVNSMSQTIAKMEEIKKKTEKAIEVLKTMNTQSSPNIEKARTIAIFSEKAWRVVNEYKYTLNDPMDDAQYAADYSEWTVKMANKIKENPQENVKDDYDDEDDDYDYEKEEEEHTIKSESPALSNSQPVSSTNSASVTETVKGNEQDPNKDIQQRTHNETLQKDKTEKSNNRVEKHSGDKATVQTKEKQNKKEESSKTQFTETSMKNINLDGSNIISLWRNIPLMVIIFVFSIVIA